MATFILNPYDADLDLSNKDDRKLFLDACKGLPKKDRFDGKRQNFGNFTKLIEQQLNTIRVTEAMEIQTKWNQGTRAPDPTGTVNIFTSNKATREQVEYHCDLVWSNSSYGNNTPRYFQEFQTNPTNGAELETLRNRRRLKHVIMGAKIWNSLTSEFQIDIQGRKTEYQRGQEQDGPLLWDFIRRHVKPTTTVGASKLKDEIESKTVADFGFNVIDYNSWFQDTREEITKEEGEGYNEYLRSLFKGYLAAKNDEFLQTINAEKRDWVQGKASPTYSYRDLMDVGRITYNNLVSDEAWGGSERNSQGGTDPEPNKFLALVTKVDTLEQRLNGKGKDGDDFTKTKGWRYHNPSNDSTKVINGRKMTWCSNDCHRRPMWCGRKVCYNREEYAERKKKEESANEEDPKKKQYLQRVQSSTR